VTYQDGVKSESGLIIMSDLPRCKENMKNMTYLAKWLGWRSPNRIGLENSVLPNYRVDLIIPNRGGLKTRCFSIAWLTWRLLLMTRLIFSFLWDFPNSIVHLIFFPFQGQTVISLLSSNLMILFLSTILLDFIEDLSYNNSKIFDAMLWS
jgi:hypothetical protein